MVMVMLMVTSFTSIRERLLVNGSAMRYQFGLVGALELGMVFALVVDF